MNKQTMRAVRKQAQQGFTLIELIVVIVILGILAATALPKFANMNGDARLAALNAARGALNTTVSVVHGQYLLNPSGPFTNEGITVTVVNGYPSGAVTTAQAAGLATTDWLIIPPNTAANAGTGGVNPATDANTVVAIPIGLQGAAQAANCYVSYTSTANSGIAPAATVTGSVANCK